MPDKQKFAWNRLILFSQHAAVYLDGKQETETKFTYALRRVLPQIGALEARVQEALADIEINNCVTETRNGTAGVIVRDDKSNLVFTAEGAKLRNKQKREHMEAETYEIEPYFARGEFPADLAVDQVIAFSGLVFPADQLDAILTRLEDAATDAGKAQDASQTATA